MKEGEKEVPPPSNVVQSACQYFKHVKLDTTLEPGSVVCCFGDKKRLGAQLDAVCGTPLAFPFHAQRGQLVLTGDGAPGAHGARAQKAPALPKGATPKMRRRPKWLQDPDQQATRLSWDGR